MVIRRVALALGLLMGIFSFMLMSNGASASGAAADPVTIQIKAQNGSGQAGTATLTDNGNNTTKVVVNLTGSPAGPQPIHIHQGTCSNLNPQVLFPLTNMVNGVSETAAVPASLATILGAAHSINVHKSAQEAAVYVSCGEIVSTMPTATPRTGGGAMASGTQPLTWAALAAVLTLAVGGTSYALRRRAA